MRRSRVIRAPSATIVGIALALTGAVSPHAAAAPPGRLLRPGTPSPSPTAEQRGERSTSPGVYLVFGLLAAAALWQVQRGRRSAQDYARAASSHFERATAPPEPSAAPPPEDERAP